MLLSLILLLLSCAAVWMYLRWQRVSGYWAQKKVPHLPLNSVLGSLPFKQNVGEWMRDLYTQFPAPYVGIWLFWRPALVINSPEIARRVLVKDADIFRNRFLSSGKTDPIGSLNIFTVNDPLWSAVRRKITTVFTSAKLKAYHTLLTTKSNELVQRIKNENDKKNVIDMKSVFTDYTTDIIGNSSFGVQSDATLTSEGPMRSITKDFQKYTLFRGLAHTSIFFCPEMVDIFRFSFFPKESTKYLTKIFRTVVQQRGGFNKPVEDSKDLLDALVKIKQDGNKEGNEISDDLLVAQAAILLQGGFDTTSTTMTFAIYELAYNPEVQEKLYREILEYKQKIGGADFTNEILTEAKYLTSVIKETLRKFSPMGYLDRIPSKEYQIDENLTIPAGTPVYVNAFGMQSDPQYFPKPNEFIPERFMPENEKDILAFTYAPFGEGPRNCIGRRFAYQTMRFGLAYLILNYEVHPMPDMPKPNDITFETRSGFLLPAQDLSVKFVPRT